MSENGWSKSDIVERISKEDIIEEIEYFLENSYEENIECEKGKTRFFHIVNIEKFKNKKLPIKYLICRALRKKIDEDDLKSNRFNPNIAISVLNEFFGKSNIVEIKLDNTKHVAIIPNNPHKNDARLDLERDGFYNGWGGGISCVLLEGQYIILYISGDIQKYQYLCCVTKINKVSKTFDFELITKFSDELSSKFSRKILLGLGLAPTGVIRYCLDKYPKICRYVSDILIQNNIINEEFWCDENLNDTTKKIAKEEDMSSRTRKLPLNQILYGPPGTGKTYNTINKALEIIFEKVEDETIIVHTFQNHSINKKISDLKVILNIKNPTDNERKDLKTVFDFYKDQIEFVTFHQSYGYEEFVEGIKASTNDKDEVIYQIENGIFKEFCEKAKTIKTNHKSIYNFDDKINIWKISLGDSQNSEEDYLFNYCINNKKILLGFGDGLDFNGLDDRKSIAKKLKDTEKYSYPPTAINTLKNKIKKDDIVLVSYGNKKLRAIAKIVGDYEFLENEELNNYVQSRTVEWLLVPEEPFIYEKILKKQFSQMSIYDIKNNVKIEKLKNLLTYQTNEENLKNYVFIIDEINRGNISKIFGELITLIEPSKRIGAEEELRVKLPYSGDIEEPFGVPSNLYILGTMNTADRSIALMDTALRRRFDFEEMMPKPNLLPNKIVIDDTDVKIQDMLTTMNNRIEYLYDRDHTVGHSYFMSLDGVEDKKAELSNIFRNKIIPLLQEYFYDDWEKIRLVLADNQADDEKFQFIKLKHMDEKKLFGDISNDYEMDEDTKVYELNADAFLEIDSYRKIYE